PYSCVWSSGDTTITATGLSAGTYTVVCTDANGCTTSGTVTVTEPPLLTTSTTSTMPTCNGGSDGSATTNPAGGTPPYAYLWDANAGNQMTMTATGLSAGTYNVTVTDANGCTVMDNVTVNQPTPLTGTIVRTPVTCNGGSDGTATVTIGGGTAPYTCVWSTGDTTNMITGLSAGTYGVTCTDANGCSLSTAINILQPTAIQLTETHTDVTCNGGSDGSGTVMASGGTPGYTYAWPTGGMASTESGLSAGTYTVTVTDDNGCTATIDVIIGEPPLLVTQISVVNSSCFGYDNGSFTVTTSGGTTPYSITWTGTVDAGGTFPATSVYTVTGLAPQMISGFVTDIYGCNDSFSATITEPAVLTSTNFVSNVSTTGGTDGAINLMVTGGTMPYSYLWSTGATAQAIDGLSAGFYSVTVTDTNGCIHLVDSIEVLEPSEFCETATEIPHVLSVHTGFFASEIGWALLNNTTGDTLSNSNCSDLNNANLTINDTVCFEPTDQYCFRAYDDWGDGWNSGSYLIADLETGDTVSSGMPNNGVNGDETAGCTGSDLELVSCFNFVIPPVSGCTDMSAANYNPNAAVDDGSCVYNISFTVDMNCMDPQTAFNDVYVTGPAVGWCGNCLPLVDQGGGIWSNTFQFPAGNFEYKYIVDNFASQEDLIDDMQGGASCAPVTDYFSYANRTVDIGTVSAVSETYGSCSPCPTGGTPGCTDVAAVNYNPSATTDDGSCQYNVTFNVDMNCSGESFSTVSVTGPFCSWCASGFELSDPDSNGVYSGTFVMSSPVEYKYMVDGFASQEDLVDDMQGGASCAPVTDYFAYANRLETFSSDITVNDAYGTCSPCPSAVSGCTDPAALNYNPSATVEDGSCIYPVANDDCGSAATVSCGSSISGTTVGSTAADAPGKCNVLLSDPGVWYEITGTGDNITVSACNANFDVRLGVFEGSCLALTCVAGDDNSCGGTGAEATFSSTLGNKYYIYISGVGTGTFDLDISCSALAACPSPENLVELNMTAKKVTLSWDPVPGAIGYAIKGNAAIATTPDVEIYPYYNGTSLTISSGLYAGIQYYWQVAAICDVSGDTSAYSPRSNFVLPTCPAPTPVLTTDVTATTAKLNWTPQPNAIRYVISGRIVPSSNIVTLNINNPATSSLNVSQLLPSSTYQWTIQSVCVGAASSIAPVQSFTTLAQTSKLATENGIGDKPTLGVHVFPNPNNGKFQLDLTNMLEEQAEIVIYDVVGKEVFRSRVSPNSADMSTSSIELNEAGTYLIKVVSENGTTISERVIVQ
ncbi:MAG: T9SS type A sorting domain-containing protein, partial [Bacteroidia bacterium]|nr:T9SS type A sorting domain-containing protein [Bacteroidia bacterium]